MHYPGSPTGKIVVASFLGAILFGACGTWICQHLFVDNEVFAAGSATTDIIAGGSGSGELATKMPIPWRQNSVAAGVFPATTRAEARRQAAESLVQPLSALPQAAAASTHAYQALPRSRRAHHRKPPPPPELITIWKNCGLFPAQGPAASQSQIAAVANSYRSIASEVTLLGVIEDRAILNLPLFSDEVRPGHSQVTVSAGDVVGKITVLAVNPDSVELDEAGKKYVKYLHVLR